MFENTYNILHNVSTDIDQIEHKDVEIIIDNTTVSNNFIDSIKTIYFPDISTRNKYEELCDNFQSFLSDNTQDSSIKKMFQVLCESTCNNHHRTPSPEHDLNLLVVKALCYYKQFVIYCVHMHIGLYTDKNLKPNINNFLDESLGKLFSLLSTNEHFIENISTVNKFYEYIIEFVPYVNFGNRYNLTRVIYETLNHYKKMFGEFQMSNIQMSRLVRRSLCKEKYVLKKYSPCDLTGTISNNMPSPTLEFVNEKSGTIVRFDIWNMRYEVKSNIYEKIKPFVKCLLTPLYVVAWIISSNGSVRIILQL